MVLRDHPSRLRGDHNRHLRLLRQAEQVLPGVLAQHHRPSDQHGPLGLIDRVGDGVQVAVNGRQGRLTRAGIGVRLSGGAHVEGEVDVDRARPLGQGESYRLVYLAAGLAGAQGDRVLAVGRERLRVVDLLKRHQRRLLWPVALGHAEQRVPLQVGVGGPASQIYRSRRHDGDGHAAGAGELAAHHRHQGRRCLVLD